MRMHQNFPFFMEKNSKKWPLFGEQLCFLASAKQLKTSPPLSFFFFVIQVQSHCSRVLRRPAHHTEYHPHPRSRSVGGAAGRRRELWTLGLRLCRIIEHVDNTEVVAPHSTPGGGGSVIGGTVRAVANPGHFPRREKQEGFRRERVAFHSHDSDVGV